MHQKKRHFSKNLIYTIIYIYANKIKLGFVAKIPFGYTARRV